MSEYVIVTDSCADLDPVMIERLGVEVIPLSFAMGEQKYENWPDGRTISFSDFYRRLREGEVSTTSQLNVADFLEAFSPYLQSGYDILYLGFSSGLSGTVGSAFAAVAELKEAFPDRRVEVVDTLAASLGQGLLVWHACERKKAGDSIDQVIAWVEANKLKLAHWFTVDDLGFLRRGGRLSGTAALVGTMLGIKPVLHVDNEGHLINVAKERGRKRSLQALADKMAESVVDAKSQMIFISHGDALDDAKYLAKEIKKRIGAKEFYFNYVGPVIGSHSGPGTMALFFLATHR